MSVDKISYVISQIISGIYDAGKFISEEKLNFIYLYTLSRQRYFNQTFNCFSFSSDFIERNGTLVSINKYQLNKHIKSLPIQKEIFQSQFPFLHSKSNI